MVVGGMGIGGELSSVEAGVAMCPNHGRCRFSRDCVWRLLARYDKVGWGEKLRSPSPAQIVYQSIRRPTPRER